MFLLSGRNKRHRIDDDDFDLLEENLGVKLKRRKKFSRVRTASSDEDEVEEDTDQRDLIKNELFEGDDEDVPHVSEPVAMCSFFVSFTRLFL